MAFNRPINKPQDLHLSMVFEGDPRKLSGMQRPIELEDNIHKDEHIGMNAITSTIQMNIKLESKHI